MHRSWQKFDDLQHEWHRKAEDLADQVKLLEAESASAKTAFEEKEKEAASSKEATSKATKEAKLVKEELRTCQLDREYYRGVAE